MEQVVAAALQEPPWRAPNHIESLEEFLHHSQHLQHLPQQQLQQLVASATTVTAPPGSYIYTQEDPASRNSSQQVFLLVQGQVSLLHTSAPPRQQLDPANSSNRGRSAHAAADGRTSAACCCAARAESTGRDVPELAVTSATGTDTAAAAHAAEQSCTALHWGRVLRPGQLFGQGQGLSAVGGQAHAAYVGLYRYEAAAMPKVQPPAAEGSSGASLAVDADSSTAQVGTTSNDKGDNSSSSSSGSREAFAAEAGVDPAPAALASSTFSSNSSSSSPPSGPEPSHGEGATSHCGNQATGSQPLSMCPCMLLAWDAAHFAAVAGPVVQAQQQKRRALLDGVASLQCLTHEQRALMAWRLQYKEYAPGDTVMKQGEPADSLYIIQYGQAGVLIEATETLLQQQLLTPRSQEQQHQQEMRPSSALHEPRPASAAASGTPAAAAAAAAAAAGGGGVEFAHSTHPHAREGSEEGEGAAAEDPEGHHAHVRRARHFLQVAVLDEGQLMGDMALQAAAGGLRTATVAALSHLVAWQLSMEDVRQLLTPEDIQAVVAHTYVLRAAANAANATTTVRAKRGLRKRALPRNLQRQLMQGSTTLKGLLSRAGEALEVPSGSSSGGGVRSGGGSEGDKGRRGVHTRSSPGGFGTGIGQQPVAAAMSRPWASEPGGLLGSLFGGVSPQAAGASNAGAALGQGSAQSTTGSSSVAGVGTLARIIAATAGASSSGRGAGLSSGPAASAGATCPHTQAGSQAFAAVGSNTGSTCAGGDSGAGQSKQAHLAKGSSSSSCKFQRAAPSGVAPDDRAGKRAGCSHPNGSCSTSAAGENSMGLVLSGGSWRHCCEGAGSVCNSTLWSSSGSSGPGSGSGMLLNIAMELAVDAAGAAKDMLAMQPQREGDVHVHAGITSSHAVPNTDSGAMDAACMVLARGMASSHRGPELLLPGCGWLPSPVAPVAVAEVEQAAAALGALMRLSKHRQAAPDQQLLQALQDAWHGMAQLPIKPDRPMTYWGAFPLPVPR